MLSKMFKLIPAMMDIGRGTESFSEHGRPDGMNDLAERGHPGEVYFIESSQTSEDYVSCIAILHFSLKCSSRPWRMVDRDQNVSSLFRRRLRTVHDPASKLLFLFRTGSILYVLGIRTPSLGW